MLSTKNITEALQKDPILRHFPTLLNQWKGKQAGLLELTSSHRKIRLKLTKNRYNHKEPHLLISMLEPIHMNGEFDWDNADIEVQFDGTYYIVLDTQNDFRFVCEQVIISEYKNL